MSTAGSRDEAQATLRESRAALRAALDLGSAEDAAGAASARGGWLAVLGLARRMLLRR